MNKILIVFVVALLFFGLGWFLKKRTTAAAPAIKIDKIINKTDTLLLRANDSSEDFSKDISGRFIMKGANAAGYNFIGHDTVLWTNELFPFDPDTLCIRWLDHRTFTTKTMDQENKGCPPRVDICQVISFDGKHLLLNEIWTGWGKGKDDITEYSKAN